MINELKENHLFATLFLVTVLSTVVFQAVDIFHEQNIYYVSFFIKVLLCVSMIVISLPMLDIILNMTGFNYKGKINNWCFLSLYVILIGNHIVLDRSDLSLNVLKWQILTEVFLTIIIIFSVYKMLKNIYEERKSRLI